MAAKADADGSVFEFCRTALALEEAPLGCCGRLWQWVKFLPAAAFLLPLRVLMITITLVMIWLVSLLSECWPCRSRDASKSGEISAHSAVQRCLLRINGLLARCVLFWCGFLWVSVHGRPSRGKEGYLVDAPTVVSNHVTAIDALFICYLLSGQMTAVAVEWVKKVPFLGRAARAHHVLHVPGSRSSGCVKCETGIESTPPVDQRSTKGGSAVEMISAYQHRRAADPRLLPLLIFPEATTKCSSFLLRFRTGAFVSGQPVQPVVLQFPHTHVDISWVQPLGTNLFRLLTQWVNRVEVTWLDVYTPTPGERADPEAYAEGVQRKMAEAMKLRPDHFSTTVGNAEVKKWLDRCAEQRRQPGGAKT